MEENKKNEPASKKNAVHVRVEFIKDRPGDKKGSKRVYHRSTAEILVAKGVAKIVEQLPKYTHPALKQ